MPETPPPTAESMPPDHAVQTFVAMASDDAFHAPAELERVWGAVWGTHDEVGRLRSVLMRAPGDELSAVRADAWDERAGALVDPDGRWYWCGRDVPDLALVRAQHAGLAAALREEGVDVQMLPPLGRGYTKAIYVRDPLVTVPGGAIVGRLRPTARRGEEADVTQALAAAGLPILGTIAGTGTLEGGSFAQLTPSLAAVGVGIRCNEEGARQLAALLANVGIKLLVVPLSGYLIHLDCAFAMVDVDRALVDPRGLPFWFLERLRTLGIEAIWADPREPWAVNCLALAPGRIVMSSSAPRTTERLARLGIDVRTLDYGEIEKNGGGIHCSTMELRRDAA